MKIPQTIWLLSIDDEEQVLDKLNELSPEELLELQALADKITELNLIVILAREEYGMRQVDGNTFEV